MRKYSSRADAAFFLDTSLNGPVPGSSYGRACMQLAMGDPARDRRIPGVPRDEVPGDLTGRRARGQVPGQDQDREDQRELPPGRSSDEPPAAEVVRVQAGAPPGAQGSAARVAEFQRGRRDRRQRGRGRGRPRPLPASQPGSRDVGPGAREALRSRARLGAAQARAMDSPHIQPTARSACYGGGVLPWARPCPECARATSRRGQQMYCRDGVAVYSRDHTRTAVRCSATLGKARVRSTLPG